MNLSIVIVSYNVKHFLRQCLNSVFESIEGLDAEVIVVDNASEDGSLQMLKNNFPKLHLIENEVNHGFGKANNQALSHINSSYVLYLNPDTIITDNCISQAIAYLDQNPDYGALGVKLIDGAANYHPESKRGFPSLWNSFTKLSGLYRLFPNSRIFNYYYLGHKSKDMTTEVDVLCGAFMLCRTELIKELNGFDEDFFMYGEDIDLCYRIKQTGAKIAYLPEASIIHFKGESSRKVDLKYIKSFYGSMLSYYKKRRSGFVGKVFYPFLACAVILMAGLSYLIKISSSVLWLIIDFVLIFVSLIQSSKLWGAWYHGDSSYYDSDQLNYLLFGFSFFYIAFQYLMGKYDKESSYKLVFRAWLAAFVICLMVYALLPETMRFSRALAFGSGILALIIISLSYYLKFLSNRIKKNQSYLVVGNGSSAQKLNEIISQNDPKLKYIGFVSKDPESLAIGQVYELPSILEKINLDQIIFSTRDIEFRNILKLITQLGNAYKYQIASEDNVSILSSRFAKKQGEIITMDLAFGINTAVSKRLKRFTDIILFIVLLGLSPILLLISRPFRKAFIKLFAVLTGQGTIISYKDSTGQLPKIKTGMFYIEEIVNDNYFEHQMRYARSYQAILDIEYLFLALKS